MLFTASAVLVSLLSANAQNSNPDAGFGLALDNSKSFCLIIPHDFGNDIAADDANGVAACWGNPKGALPTKELPNGLITSAHFVKTSAYSQVTGKYNPAAYGLNPNDQGTQWDNSLKSQGGVMPQSGCAGFPQYLELFGSNIYCLRCCTEAFSSYCNPSHDTLGCEFSIAGNYGDGFSDGVGDPVPPKSLVSDYENCTTDVDVCASNNFQCCVAIGDWQSGDPHRKSKTTCRPPSDCHQSRRR